MQAVRLQVYIGNDRFKKLQPWPVLSLLSALACASGLTVHLTESSTSSSVAGPSPASLTAPPRLSEFVSDDELYTLSKGLIPKNTGKNTMSALNTFEGGGECSQQAISRRPHTRQFVYMH